MSILSLMANGDHSSMEDCVSDISVCAVLIKRRRRNVPSDCSSSLGFASIAVLVIATSCLWITPAAGFLSTTTCPSSSAGRKNAAYLFTSQRRRVAPFTTLSVTTAPFTRLSMAASPGDKEEWRAILLSFQLYKAAYGDLKIPTRFVVPSMQPWPGTLLVES